MGLLDKDPLGAVTANPRLMRQGLLARQNRPAPPTEQGLLDSLALGTAPIPILGDLIGLGADANRFIKEPESRTPANFGLAALGLLPFVPAAGAAAGLWKGSAGPAMGGNQLGAVGDVSKRSRAAIGGEVAKSNEFFYKGGQFLPSTDAPPGTWRVGKKIMSTGKAQVSPGQWEVQPTPLSRPIYEIVSGWTTRGADGKLSLHEGALKAGSISPDDLMRPGVKGILSKNEYKVQELIDQYNSGNRWLNLDVDLPVIKGK